MTNWKADPKVQEARYALRHRETASGHNKQNVADREALLDALCEAVAASGSPPSPTLLQVAVAMCGEDVLTWKDGPARHNVMMMAVRVFNAFGVPVPKESARASSGSTGAPDAFHEAFLAKPCNLCGKARDWALDGQLQAVCYSCGSTGGAPPKDDPQEQYDGDLNCTKSCPCGAVIEYNGQTVKANWTGSICSDCESAIMTKTAGAPTMCVKCQEYHALLDGGLSDYEARETVWPEAEENPAAWFIAGTNWRTQWTVNTEQEARMLAQMYNAERDESWVVHRPFVVVPLYLGAASRVPSESPPAQQNEHL